MILGESVTTFLLRPNKTYPVFNLTVPYWVVYAIAWPIYQRVQLQELGLNSRYVIPGPLAATSASSPMKKSRSSVPRFPASEPPDPAPPVRYEGLFATAGRPEPDPPVPPTPPLVAIAVGKTNEGASLPANPRGHH